MVHCSSDTGINETEKIHKIQTGKDVNAKRKLKSSTNASDFDTEKRKSAKSSKSSRMSKKACRNYSESSQYDSELEREMKIMGKIRPDRVIKTSVSYKKVCDSSEDEKHSKISGNLCARSIS